MSGLVKRFTATLALDHVDFDVRRGEVHALLGQNGAGKSTLIKILAGVYEADAGAIEFDGKPARPMTQPLPVAFIHQDLGLVEWMTVAENVAIQTGYPRSGLGLISWRRVRDAAAEALAIMGSDLDPDAPISSLPAAERSLVAIGRALAIKSDIVVLDEPTAALPEADVERLLETLRRLRANDIGVVFVTHRLDEVFRIADRVTVLRDGRRLATLPAQETNAADLVQMIVGRSMNDAFVKPAPPAERCVLSVQSLAAEHVGPVSFSVAAGETLGLVGLRGAGHHTIGRAIFGETRIASGRLLLDGEPIAPRSPAEAMANGIGFVSSRRAEEGIASNMAVRENIYHEPGGERQTRARIHPPRKRAERSQRSGEALFHQGGERRAAGSDAFRRKSAEGGGRSLDGGPCQAAHSRGADHRRRRRGEGGHLPPASALAGQGARGSADFIRFRGGRAHLPSRAGFQSRTDGGGDSPRSLERRRIDRDRIGRDVDRPARSDAMSSGGARSFSAVLTRAISVWGLLVLFVLLVVVFSLLRPETFLTYFNIRSILSNKSVQLLVALSVFIPMVANQFDLSAGFNVGISQVLAIGLQGQGWPWWAAICAVLLMGAAVGLANGLLITRVKIDSFIATLGTGTILYGLNAWYTGGQQVLAALPPEFLAISGRVWIVPAPAIYALVVSLTLWVVFEYLPLGRYLYVLGASPRAAELNGISAKRYITLAFVAAGTLASFAGVVLQSQLQVGQSSVGQEYLLPAFTAALLGATSIRPGRVNVWGTVLAVAVLAVTVAGLNQLGAPFFVEPLFNGSMLILAVGLAVQAAQRRQRRGTEADDRAVAGAAAPVVE